MCGIVGYIGEQNCIPILLEGLKRLEYRGYDSAGIACIENSEIVVQKAAGKISVLEKLLAQKDYYARLGIGHTRWATHGEPSDINAHPHIDDKGRIAVVHNGIIENYQSLRTLLQKKGHIFITDTDTEIIAHLISEYYDGDLLEAVRMAMTQVDGTYGIAVVSLDNPDRIVAARLGSPLVIGNGEGENFVASDVAAILRHTNQVVYLEDRELAEITRDGFRISKIDKPVVSP
jgi:glucosamine--fructose-6-phosphate aminotransferase (isomerizing)